MELMTLPTEIKTCLLDCLNDHASYFDKYETHSIDVEVEEVPHLGCDGFIPYTNGGYKLSFLSELGLAWGSGSHSTVIQPYIESCLKDSLQYFKDENPDFDETDENDTLWDSFSEYESDYLSEGGAFWYELRVYFFSADNYRNKSGQDEIYIFSGTNTDFEYGRDSGLQIAFEVNLIVSELTCDLLKDTLQNAINSI